jgi:hypothetical protein
VGNYYSVSSDSQHFGPLADAHLLPSKMDPSGLHSDPAFVADVHGHLVLNNQATPVTLISSEEDPCNCFAVFPNTTLAWNYSLFPITGTLWW